MVVKFSRNHGVDAKSSRSEAPFRPSKGFQDFFSYFISCLVLMGYELELFMILCVLYQNFRVASGFNTAWML